MNYLPVFEIYLEHKNMKIIGISGLARSGKDSFYNLSTPFLDERGIKHKRLAFADELKNECDPFLKKNIGISAFTEVNKEKEIIRPLLVTYGTHIRRKLDPNCWINKIEPKIRKQKEVDLFFITDVRFKNEIDWVHSMGGTSIHVQREGVLPPNKDEEENDPILNSCSNFKVSWGNFNKENKVEILEKINTIISNLYE